MENVCSCGVATHAINCPLRANPFIYAAIMFPTSDEKDGCAAGFAAGMIAATQTPVVWWIAPPTPHSMTRTAHLDGPLPLGRW